MRDIFRGFGAVFYKEALHIRRDAGTLFFSLTMPLMQMFLLGFGIDTNIRHIPTVVYNADGRRESRELIDQLKNSDTFYIMRYVQSDHEMNDIIVAGKARVGIKVPVDYSDKLLHGMSAQVLVLIDGSDSSVAGQAINVSNAIGLQESLKRVLQDRNVMAVEMRPKMLFNPDSRSPNFFLPGLTAIMLLNVTTFLTAFSIVREKERGTFEQLFVTPVKPFGLMIGKLLPYLCVGFFELCLILTCMRFIFRVPDPRQRFAARRSRAALPFRGAVAWHPDIRQSCFAGGSDAARVSSHFAQRVFLRLYFPPRNDACAFSADQLPDSRDVFHQYHARRHFARGNDRASLDRWPRTFCDRYASPDHRCAPFPEQSDFGLDSK